MTRVADRSLLMIGAMISGRHLAVLLGALFLSLGMLGIGHAGPAGAMPPLAVDVGDVQQFSATLRVRARGPSEVAVQVYRRALIPGARQPRLRVYGRPQVLFFDRWGLPPEGRDRPVVVEGLRPDGVYYYRAWTPEGFVVRGHFSTRR